MTIVGISNLYYKGQNSAETQDTARNILTEVSKQLEYDGDVPDVASPDAVSDPVTGTDCPTITLKVLTRTGSPTTETQYIWCATATAPGVTTTAYAFCVGDIRYSFVLDHELAGTTDANHSQHVLWEDTLQDGAANCLPMNVLTGSPDGNPLQATITINGVPVPSTAAPAVASSGKELLLPNMRLSGFDINPEVANANSTNTYNAVTNNLDITDIYDVDIGVAYGDTDLLSWTAPSLTSPTPTIGSSSCLDTVGDQFCDVSVIDTSVARRLE